MVRVGTLNRPQALDALFHPVVLFVLLLLVTVRAFAGSATLASNQSRTPRSRGTCCITVRRQGAIHRRSMQAIRPPVPFPI